MARFIYLHEQAMDLPSPLPEERFCAFRAVDLPPVRYFGGAVDRTSVSAQFMIPVGTGRNIMHWRSHYEPSAWPEYFVRALSPYPEPSYVLSEQAQHMIFSTSGELLVYRDQLRPVRPELDINEVRFTLIEHRNGMATFEVGGRPDTHNAHVLWLQLGRPPNCMRFVLRDDSTIVEDWQGRFSPLMWPRHFEHTTTNRSVFRITPLAALMIARALMRTPVAHVNTVVIPDEEEI